jgi:hypothetical protein
MSLITQGYGYSRNHIILGMDGVSGYYYSDIDLVAPSEIYERIGLFIPEWAVLAKEFALYVEKPKIIIPTLYVNVSSNLSLQERIEQFIECYINATELQDSHNDISTLIEFKEAITSNEYYIADYILAQSLDIEFSTSDSVDRSKRKKRMKAIYELIGV